MPQNNAGCSVITDGPGWMPWMIMAPIIRAITGLDGIPNVSMGMKEVWAPALFADFRCGHSFDGTLSELAAVFGDLLLEGIRAKGGERGPAARQDSERRAQRGASHRSGK